MKNSNFGAEDYMNNNYNDRGVSQGSQSVMTQEDDKSENDGYKGIKRPTKSYLPKAVRKLHIQINLEKLLNSQNKTPKKSKSEQIIDDLETNAGYLSNFNTPETSGNALTKKEVLITEKPEMLSNVKKKGNAKSNNGMPSDKETGNCF